MARTKADKNSTDPATGKFLPPGVTYLGPSKYRARKLIKGNRVSNVCDTARLAREWLADAEASVRRDEYVDRRPLSRLTVKDLVDRFVAEVLVDGGPRRGAAEDRASHIPSILNDRIASISLADLGPADVTAWRKRLLVHYKPATVVKRMNLLSQVFSYARAELKVPMKENPASAENASRPRNADVQRTRRLNLADAAAVRAATEAGEDPPPNEEARLLAEVAKSKNPHDLLMVRFAIAQAVRRGESTGLRWGDVDLEGRVLTLHGRHRRGTKENDHATREPEQRPLMREAADLLRSMLPEDGKPDPDEVIFKVGDPTAFSVRMGRMMRRAGLVGLRFHDLRREATTRLASRYPVHADLRRVTGHSNAATMERYYQPRPGDLARQGDDAAD